MLMPKERLCSCPSVCWHHTNSMDWLVRWTVQNASPSNRNRQPSTTSIPFFRSCSRAVWLEMAPLSPGRGDNSDNAASWLPQAPGSTLNDFTGQREPSEQPPDFSHIPVPASFLRNFEESLEQLSHTPISVASQGQSDLEGTTTFASIGESHSFTLVEERQDQGVNALDQAILGIPVDEAGVNQGHDSGIHTL